MCVVLSGVKLSPQSLPSIAFYTFLNGYKNVNCLSVSTDSSIVAAGFADSTVRLWDLNTSADSLQYLYAEPAAPASSSSTESATSSSASSSSSSSSSSSAST